MAASRIPAQYAERKRQTVAQRLESRRKQPAARVLRRVSRLLVAASLVVSCGWIAASCGRFGTPRARHVLLICVDTLRYDHVGSYGYGRPTTPSIDALARHGTRAELAYSTSNWTLPAVASVFTGLLPEEHGAGLHGEMRRLGPGQLPTGIRAGVPTLAETLARSGFATRLFSANPFLKGKSLQRGFAERRVERRPADELTARALEWFRAAGEQRLFVYLQYMDAHHPNRPPPEYQGMFGLEPGEERDPAAESWSFGQLTSRETPGFESFARQRIGAYDGSIRFVDDQIGRLLDGLEKLGLLEQTLVVVFSDHGEEFWDHAIEQSSWKDNPRDFWGVGHGHQMYEELVRVPLIVAGPGIPADKVETCPVSLLDVGTVVLGTVGDRESTLGHGRQLGSSRGEACGGRALTVSSNAYGPSSRVVRLGRFKLVRRGANERFVDLELDPLERRHSSAVDVGVQASLRRILDSLARMEAASRSSGESLGEDSLDELRSLGYL